MKDTDSKLLWEAYSNVNEDMVPDTKQMTPNERLRMAQSAGQLAGEPVVQSRVDRFKFHWDTPDGGTGEPSFFDSDLYGGSIEVHDMEHDTGVEVDLTWDWAGYDSDETFTSPGESKTTEDVRVVDIRVNQQQVPEGSDTWNGVTQLINNWDFDGMAGHELEKYGWEPQMD